jgi:hypothetical protein
VEDRSLTIRHANHAPQPGILAYFRETKIRGMVNARNVGHRRALRVDASLHGLEPGTAHRVVGSTRRCSQEDTAAARVFTFDLETATASDDAYRGGRARRRGSLRTIRSVRILSESEPGKFGPQECTRFNIDVDSNPGEVT